VTIGAALVAGAPIANSLLPRLRAGELQRATARATAPRNA
jgi:hypothetical protein